MADAKKAGEKPQWEKVGNGQVWNTRQSGAKRVTKNGIQYYMGGGTLTLDGKAHNVMFTLMPGREGSFNVFVEKPPTDGK